MAIERFSGKVVEQLKYYVYVYIDPRTDQPFYIGKGKGNRVFSHLGADDDSGKSRVLGELRDLQLRPRIELLKYGLTEAEALLVEATAIDLLDVRKLTNEMRGHGSYFGARASVEEVQERLNASPVEVVHACLLINITRAFRYGMLPIELYDATRSAWRVGKQRERAEFGLSVYRGIVREVYEIRGWLPSASTLRHADGDGRNTVREGRWEFVGLIAREEVRKRYRGRSVAAYFRAGSQNPVRYVNCGVHGNGG